jgi:uncharacterized protein (TIGR00251 family)
MPEEGMVRVENTGAVLLKLKIHPGAKRSAVNGTFGDAVKIDLQSPPVDGKANAALIKFLAALLGVPKAAVELKSGECSRDKVVRISGKTPDEIIELLKI